MHVGDTITYNDRQHTLGSKQARSFAVIVEFHKNPATLPHTAGVNNVAISVTILLHNLILESHSCTHKLNASFSTSEIVTV